MEFLLTAHGARRDELSRLGQNYGTAGSHYEPACLAELEPGDNVDECWVHSTLGGNDAAYYQTMEVRQRRIEIDPCVMPNPEFPWRPQTTGECSVDEAFLSRNIAFTQVAEELAQEMDSQPHRGDYNRVGPTTNDVWGVALKGDIALGGSVFLTSVSSYDHYDRMIDIDLDFSPNQLFQVATQDEGWQLTQSLDFSGHVSEDVPLRWNLGGYFLMEEITVNIRNSFRPNLQAFGVSTRNYTQKLWSAAGYAGFEWDFWDDFTLDGGVRYNWEHKTIDYLLGLSTGFEKQYLVRTWQAPTGTIRLTYRFREDTHAYWKYTRGWKGGHYNATSSQREGVTAAEPEVIDAFEAGLRGSFFDGRLGASFSVFHYTYDNYQIFIAQQKLGAQPEFVVLNANNAEVYGAELDLVARPLPGTYLQARLSWLESQFLDFIQDTEGNEQRGATALPIDIQIQNSGNPLLNSPRYKVSLTAEQTLPLGRFGSLAARWDGAWTDDTNYDATKGKGIPNSQGVQFLPDNTIGQSAFWLHNLRLAYRTPGGNVEVAGWVRNLEDKVYKTFAFDASALNNATIYFLGEPRTYGLTVTTTF
jgi:iron complex outermembrane receptor protein